MDNVAAVAECASAGARLVLCLCFFKKKVSDLVKPTVLFQQAIFDKREDLEAVESLSSNIIKLFGFAFQFAIFIASSSTPYWVGAHVPTDKGTTLCNSNNGPDECKGFFKWDDASPITWTSDDIQNWYQEVYITYVQEMSQNIYLGLLASCATICSQGLSVPSCTREI